MSTGADARHVRESVRGCAVAVEARRSARASVPHPRLLRGKSKPPAHRKPLVFANPSSTDFIYRLRTHTYKMSCHAGGRFRGFLARTCSPFARTSRHDTSSRPFLRLVTSTRSPRMRRSRRPSTLPPSARPIRSSRTSLSPPCRRRTTPARAPPPPLRPRFVSSPPPPPPSPPPPPRHPTSREDREPPPRARRSARACQPRARRAVWYHRGIPA